MAFLIKSLHGRIRVYAIHRHLEQVILPGIVWVLYNISHALSRRVHYCWTDWHPLASLPAKSLYMEHHCQVQSQSSADTDLPQLDHQRRVSVTSRELPLRV